MASFYDTYRQRTAENEQAGMRDLQQMGTLAQLQQTMRARQDEQELKSMLQQTGGDLDAVVKGALKAGRPDIAAKLAPLIEAQRKAQPQPQSIGSGGLRMPDGTIVPPASRPEQPKPQSIGAGGLRMPDGTVVPPASRPEVPKPTDVARLLAERAALPAGDPRRAVYDAAIKRETAGPEKTYPIVTTEDGIFERTPGGLVRLKNPLTGEPLKPPARHRPITEYQGKNAMYGVRAKMADKTLLELEEKISVAGLSTKRALQDVPVVGGVLGAAGNVMLSKQQQQVEQAQRNFVNAVLRQESGAVINPSEFENAIKQYFPQPGDQKEVIAQKRANRTAVIEGFKKIAGPAWDDQQQVSPPGGWSITPVQ